MTKRLYRLATVPVVLFWVVAFAIVVATPKHTPVWAGIVTVAPFAVLISAFLAMVLGIITTAFVTWVWNGKANPLPFLDFVERLFRGRIS